MTSIFLFTTTGGKKSKTNKNKQQQQQQDPTPTPPPCPWLRVREFLGQVERGGGGDILSSAVWKTRVQQPGIVSASPGRQTWSLSSALQKQGKRGSLGGAAVWRLPLAQGAILEIRDRIPYQAPGAWSLLLPLPVSLPLSLSHCVPIMNK